MVKDRYLSSAIKAVVSSEFSQFPSTSLVGAIHQLHQDKLYILATVRTPRVLAPDQVRTIQDALSQQLSLPTELIVRTVLAKDIGATGSTSQVTAQNLDGFFLTGKLAPDVLKVQLAEQALREILVSRPEITLSDVTILRFPRGPVILATMQGSRALIPAEIREIEKAMQDRLGDHDIRLLTRFLTTVDVDSQGRVLYGWAHFGSQSPAELALQEQAEQAVRKGFAKFSDIFLTNVDAISNPEGWLVRVETAGARLISAQDLANLEKSVSRQLNKPTKIDLWFRGEVMVTRDGYSSVEEFTRKRLQEKGQSQGQTSTVNTPEPSKTGVSAAGASP
jgi:hypothetical protein